MGYRSQVVIAINKRVLTDNIKQDLSDADMVEDKGDYIVFAYESVKWYEGYPEVDNVMDFLEELDETDFGFLRVGEEESDIERMGEPYYFELYVDRVINY